MKYYLVKSRKDWADEFDCYGLEVYVEDEYNRYINFLEENKDMEVSLYFGTNEGWDDVTWEDIKEDITIEEITEEEYEMLKKLRLTCYGNIALVSDMVAEISDIIEYREFETHE